MPSPQSIKSNLPLCSKTCAVGFLPEAGKAEPQPKIVNFSKTLGEKKAVETSTAFLLQIF